MPPVALELIASPVKIKLKCYRKMSYWLVVFLVLYLGLRPRRHALLFVLLFSARRHFADVCCFYLLWNVQPSVTF